MDTVSHVSYGPRVKTTLQFIVPSTYTQGLYRGEYIKAYECIENVRNAVGKRFAFDTISNF